MGKRAVALTLEQLKAQRVQDERTRLMELFTGADENKLDFIRDTVQQLAWLGVSIKDLQAEIDDAGAVIPYQNGQTQKGLQANPACKLLIDYQKLYNTQFRALLPVLPEKADYGDPFAEFRPNKLKAFMVDNNYE